MNVVCVCRVCVQLLCADLRSVWSGVYLMMVRQIVLFSESWLFWVTVCICSRYGFVRV